jgi:hypothetical protein
MKRELTEQEVDYIFHHLQSLEINDEKVLSELTDHLSILTEVELLSTTDFETAYNVAFKKFSHKDLLAITNTKQSFYAYPKFLNKRFLTVLGIVSASFFVIGLYLRFHQLPYRRLFQFVGGIGFGYIFLPLLLLYWLTEYANKTKYTLLFMVYFTGFQTVVATLFQYPLAKFLLPHFIIFLTVYTILFFNKHTLFSK